MGCMFCDARALESVPQFDTHAVSNMSEMFCGASSLRNVPLFSMRLSKRWTLCLVALIA